MYSALRLVCVTHVPTSFWRPKVKLTAIQTRAYDKKRNSDYTHTPSIE